MPYGITDFTRTGVSYDSDDGEAYAIEIRTEYVTKTGLNGPAPGTIKPVGMVPRHVWCGALNGTKVVRRKVPCSKAFADTMTIGTTTVNADGMNLKITGYVGEKRRGKNVPLT